MNQVSAVSVIPYVCVRMSKRREWSIVSKAAERSSRVTIEMSPWSKAISESFITFTRAVSVLSAGLYAD